MPVRRRPLSLDEYAAGVAGGNRTALAQALTLVESSRPEHERLAAQLLTRLAPLTGRALRVGISGVPGAGKSTLIDVLGRQLVDAGQRVAVLAVDPSSTVTGGSILGDKTRMGRLAASPSAFIRPSPSSGTLGGVARKTREAALVCEAAGFDVVLVETVGVGQSETVVAEMTDCFVALLLAGGGDELQGIKRGLLEWVDVLAINKADGANREAATLAARQYRNALHAQPLREGSEPAEVVTCSAATGVGIAELWQTIRARYDRMAASGDLQRRRRRQNLHWLWSQVDEALHAAVRRSPQVAAIRADLEQRVTDGSLSAADAAAQVLAAFAWPGKSGDEALPPGA